MWEANAQGLPNRLLRFRGLLSTLDPAGDPARALVEQRYVPFPGAVAAQISATLELRPQSTHLVVGGVGSGKTTELVEVRRRLSETPDIKALYVDVTKGHDIAHLKPGVAILQAGLEIATFAMTLARALGTPDMGAREARTLTDLSFGYWSDEHYPEGDEADFYAGALRSPNQVDDVVDQARRQVAVLVAVGGTTAPRYVVLLDGLDRATDTAGFDLIVDQDVKALRALGVGVVLVGPLKCLYRSDRAIADSFDKFHLQPWRDPKGDSDAAQFFGQVLRRRLGPDALDEVALHELVTFSGGVLRDLISLAQLACEEAYLGGADIVSAPHVHAAVEAFGRKHVLGLQLDEIEILQRVRKLGTFVQTSEKELALLMTRRVLEYGGGRGPRYVVHPTIDAPLRRMAGQAA